MAYSQPWLAVPGNRGRSLDGGGSYTSRVLFVPLALAGAGLVASAAGRAALEAAGMVVNEADTASIRARLGDFTARWRARFDPAAWALLEAAAGGVGS